MNENQSIKDIITHAKTNFQQSINLLKRWVAIPSISAKPTFAEQVRQAATFVQQILQNSGFQAQTWETNGHPAVFAEYIVNPDLPTALIYGHYDVQPEDPLDEWVTPPFQATERDGNLYGRGVSDDKGLIVMLLAGIQAWIETTGTPPCNIKCLFEGEEEIGSPNLGEVIRHHREKLACNLVVVADTDMFTPTQPSLNYGLRGLAACEVEVTTAQSDLHSGSFGGLVNNPIMVLAQMLSQLRNPQGVITVPGFYDDVLEPEPWEIENMHTIGFDAQAYCQLAGTSGLWGEPEVLPLQRVWTRPTLEPNGIVGGYTGQGIKTVLPRRASAKISLRLVPNQNPEKMIHALESYLRSLCPDTATLRFTSFGGSPGVVFPTHHPYFECARQALMTGFPDTKPVLIREGGSIPILGEIFQLLQQPMILFGLRRPDDRIHAPNEKQNLSDFGKGINTSIAFWGYLSQSTSTQ